ncbi:hypothetical protein Tco_0289359 [Tanacetum coccineum]
MDLMKSLNDFISLEAWKLLKKPNMVFSHFANRFDKCHEYRVHIDSQFPNILSMDQVEELEREVTYDEVKKAILDGPLILNELISWCKIKRYKEVDIEKARDSVRWDYVDDILYKDVYVGEWNDSNLCTIVHVVKCLFQASGLKISMSKSMLMGRGVENREMVRTANVVEGSVRKMGWVSWDKVLVSKHNGGLRDEYVSKISLAGFIKEVDILKIKGIDLMSFCIKKVGNGVGTLFSEDDWMSDLSLKCQFLRLYALETCKQISIAKKLKYDSVAYFFPHVPRGGLES